MARFTADHMAFAASKTRYMGREESIEFLKTLNIQLSVGHWSAGDFCDRFAPPGYHSDDPAFKSDFEAQCRRTKAAGVDAIEIAPERVREDAERRPRHEAHRARAGRLPARARHDGHGLQHQRLDQPEVPAGRSVQSRSGDPTRRARRDAERASRSARC